MKARALLVVAILLGLLMLTVTSALAGGWATIHIEAMPDAIRANEPFTIEFTVWQHGNKPVHRVAWDGGKVLEITPRIELRHLDTGEALRFVAAPMKQNGRYAVEMVLPTEGRWAWTMALDPLTQEGELAALAVQPASMAGGAVALTAAGASASSSGAASPGSPFVALVAIAAAAAGGLALIVFEWRNRRAPAAQ